MTPVALVCVPGLGLRAAVWHTMCTALRGHPAVRSVATSELPGFGHRAASGDDLDPSTLGVRLAVDLQDRSVLVGHSASSQVVVRTAAAAPERVVALVLVGPTTDPRARSWPRLAARWLRTAVWEAPWQVPFLVRSYTRTGFSSMRRAMEAARQDDLRVGLGAVRCPVLVVRGHRDRICPGDWAHELVRTAPAGSRTVTLPRGAHMVPLTQGDLLAATIERWLDDLPSGPGVTGVM